MLLWLLRRNVVTILRGSSLHLLRLGILLRLEGLLCVLRLTLR